MQRNPGIIPTTGQVVKKVPFLRLHRMTRRKKKIASSIVSMTAIFVNWGLQLRSHLESIYIVWKGVCVLWVEDNANLWNYMLIKVTVLSYQMSLSYAYLMIIEVSRLTMYSFIDSLLFLRNHFFFLSIFGTAWKYLLLAPLRFDHSHNLRLFVSFGVQYGYTSSITIPIIYRATFFTAVMTSCLRSCQHYPNSQNVNNIIFINPIIKYMWALSF